MGTSPQSTTSDLPGLSCPRKRNALPLPLLWKSRVMVSVICCPLTHGTLHRRPKMRRNWLTECESAAQTSLSKLLWVPFTVSAELFSLDLAA